MKKTQWIQATQLAERLKVKEKFAGIDIYRVIAKLFYFPVFYQTPTAHAGLCVIPGAPIDEDTPYQNIFLARVPIEEIIKEFDEKNPNSGIPLDVLIGEFQQEVSQIIHTVTKDCSMQIAGQNQIADLFKHYFESHGFQPNSSLCASNASRSAAATQVTLPDTYPEKENTKTEADKKKVQLVECADVQKGKEKTKPIGTINVKTAPQSPLTPLPTQSASSRSSKQMNKQRGNYQ